MRHRCIGGVGREQMAGARRRRTLAKTGDAGLEFGLGVGHAPVLPEVLERHREVGGLPGVSRSRSGAG